MIICGACVLETKIITGLEIVFGILIFLCILVNG
jgi:hypothetical protein